jgi:hypothetical protein
MKHGLVHWRISYVGNVENKVFGEIFGPKKREENILLML